MIYDKSKHTNPKVKFGDKIILVETDGNGNEPYIGDTFTVTTNRKTPTNASFKAKNNNGVNRTFFYSHPKDFFVLTDDNNYRSTVADIKENKIKELEKEIISLKQEVEFLRKFDSEEDFVAHKLDEILTAHSSSKNKKKRTSAISDVLKQLKESNLL